MIWPSCDIVIVYIYVFVPSMPAINHKSYSLQHVSYTNLVQKRPFVEHSTMRVFLKAHLQTENV